MNRVAIIGNGGGGKTTLARKLGRALELPVCHVDSVQFQPGWKPTPASECDAALDQLASEDRWIIDGFGSKPVMTRRFAAADTIVFVDFALWRHYWWACKRQLKSFRGQRAELPANCPETSFWYHRTLARVMWRVHRDLRPWFIEQLALLPSSTTIFRLRTPKQWRALANRFDVSPDERTTEPSTPP